MQAVLQGLETRKLAARSQWTFEGVRLRFRQSRRAGHQVRLPVSSLLSFPQLVSRVEIVEESGFQWDYWAHT